MAQTWEIFTTVVSILLTNSLSLSAPDSIGRVFLYTLPEGVNGNLTLNSANQVSLQCNVTSGGDNQIPTGTLYTLEVAGYIKISCSNDITATLSVGRALSALLPVDVLGTQYTAITDQVVITVTAGFTEVTVFLPDDSPPHTVNTSGSVDLANEFPSIDLPGAKIESSKPISVLNGNISIPPTNTWGKKYIFTRLSGDRKYTLVGEATCRLNGEEVTFSDRMADVTDAGVLVCDESIFVGLFDGDELLTITPSVVQFPNNLLVSTPKEDSDYNLYIQLGNYSIPDILINGEPAAKADSTPISDEYTEVHYTISKGTYLISHKNPTAGLFAYVTDSSDSLVSLSPLRMADTGDYCKRSDNTNNDGIDNDCDGAIDEELLNGVDDDSDGQVDEDIATNDFFGDTRDNSGSWPMSYTVLIIVLLVVLLVILIALCHWQCNMWDPSVKDMENDLMVTSYDSRAGTAPPRYSLSGSRAGFTISRR